MGNSQSSNRVNVTQNVELLKRQQEHERKQQQRLEQERKFEQRFTVNQGQSSPAVADLYTAIRDMNSSEVIDICNLIKAGGYLFDPAATLTGAMKQRYLQMVPPLSEFCRVAFGMQMTYDDVQELQNHCEDDGDERWTMNVDGVKPYLLVFLYSIYDSSRYIEMHSKPTWTDAFKAIVSISDCSPEDALFGQNIVQFIIKGNEKRTETQYEYIDDLFDFYDVSGKWGCTDKADHKNLFPYDQTAYSSIVQKWANIQDRMDPSLFELMKMDHHQVVRDVLEHADTKTMFSRCNYVLEVVKRDLHVHYLKMLVKHGHDAFSEGKAQAFMLAMNKGLNDHVQYYLETFDMWSRMDSADMMLHCLMANAWTTHKNVELALEQCKKHHATNVVLVKNQNGHTPLAVLCKDATLKQNENESVHDIIRILVRQGAD